MASLFEQNNPMTKDQKLLLQWYSENKRSLPWRGSQDPYAIWLSEVMLQQTTVTAVIPFFLRFIEKFPNVSELAKAKESDVLKEWAGLGYYSRARMLHRSAKEIAVSKFPTTHQELLNLYGFGPYTARAVASLAFGKSVGVVDGNVIRVLSRRFGTKTEWWKPKGRETIQKYADHLVKDISSSDMNQALMDLGSMICTPQNPKCTLCPWIKTCVANAEGRPEFYPGKKPRRSKEIWLWEPQIYKQGKKILFVENSYAPFLKGQWLPPGRALRKSAVPKSFLFRHCITHHEIFVQLKKSSVAPINAQLNARIKNEKNGKFVDVSKITEVNPTSLVRKLMEHT